MGFLSKLINRKKTAGSLNLKEATPIGAIFPDAGLAECIRRELRKFMDLKETEDCVTMKELLKIKELHASGEKIVSLEGLEYLLGLNYADLSNNLIAVFPFKWEDLEAVNQTYQCFFSLNKFLVGQVTDLSGNRLSSVPEYIRDCRRRESHLVFDLSDNPLQDDETKVPTAEGILDYIGSYMGETLSEGEWLWLLYGVNAWYLSVEEQALVQMAESDAYGFEAQPLIFEKADSKTVSMSACQHESLREHITRVENLLGREAVYVKRADRNKLAAILDTWHNDNPARTDPEEPFNTAEEHGIIDNDRIKHYYQRHRTLFGALRTADEKSGQRQQRRSQIRKGLLIIQKAEEQASDQSVKEKLSAIGHLTASIGESMEACPEQHYFDFEENYLPMLTDLLEQYSSAPENSDRRQIIEKALDPVLEAFTRYREAIDSKQEMALYLDVEVLTGLFEKNGLIDKKKG